MTPKGNNITIKPEPREKVRKSGIIIPDTTTPTTQQWGVVVDGNGFVDDGSRALFIGNKCFTLKDNNEEIKLVNIKKLLYWYEK